MAAKSVPSSSRPFDLVAADPIVGAPSRIDVLGDRIAVSSAALTGEPEAPRLLALRRLGDVDVEQRVRRQARAHHVGGEPLDEARRRREAEVAASRERDGDRRDAEQHAFHRRRYRPRVVEIVTEIGPAIDPRDHEPRPVRRERVDAEKHAVRRRAVDGKPAGYGFVRRAAAGAASASDSPRCAPDPARPPRPRRATPWHHSAPATPRNGCRRRSRPES